MDFSVSSRPQSQEMRQRWSPQPSGRLSMPHNSTGGNLTGKRKVGVSEQLTRLSPLSLAKIEVILDYPGGPMSPQRP